MRRHLTAGILAGLTGLTLTGAAIAQDAAAPADQTTADAPAAYDPATVLVTINGEEITLGHAIALLGQLPEQYQQIPDAMLMKGLVDQLIDQALLAQSTSGSPEEDPLVVRLGVENERRSALASLAVNDLVGGPVDEAAIEARYQEQIAGFTPAQEYKAAHILVGSEEEAADLKAQIDGGADFAALAAEHSTDPGSGAQGGELGWFDPAQMVPEFSAAVTSLEPGAISDPVQSQFGWHIVKLEDTRDTAPPTLAELRPEIENALRQEQLVAELEELRAAATIDRPEGVVADEAIRATDILQN